MKWSTKPVTTELSKSLLEKYKIEDYAELCLTNLDRHKAALELADGDMMEALAISEHWANSYELERHLKTLRSDPESIKKIASSFDVAMLYWSIANSPTSDTKDRINAAKEFASITGIYDSKIPNIENNQNNMAVMIVNNFGDNEQWETAAQKQQEKLVNQRNEQRLVN